MDWAADEAELHQVPLQLVHASKGERYEGAALTDTLGRPSERVLAENIIGSARERAQRRHPDLKIATEILMEDPEAALLNAGRNASTLVTGSRGRSEITGLLLGSVSLAVAARADCPVVVLRGSHDSQATPPGSTAASCSGSPTGGKERPRSASPSARRRPGKRPCWPYGPGAAP
ncbi:universal stress protein [Streptomyces brevispora]|uniref:universal stress protein n=1 Tax=Streptomyces brevispora TaxID=887462 RepID=UPI002DD7C532|nr:universal stress protein [Streptomyces brevispora]